MARAAIGALLDLMAAAFDGNPETSLIGNLMHVRDQDWTRTLAPGGRSIRDITLHAGAAKYAYHDFAFGSATLSWGKPMAQAAPHGDSVEHARRWLHERKRLCREAVAALEDTALDVPRRVHYGGTETTRFIIHTFIQHDLYHAGEINHLRALLQDDDFWPGRRRS